MFTKVNLFGDRMDAPAYSAKSALRVTVGVIASKGESELDLQNKATVRRWSQSGVETLALRCRPQSVATLAAILGA